MTDFPDSTEASSDIAGVTPDGETPPQIPSWVDVITGDVKTNSELHIWSSDSASAVITSESYVRLG